MHEETCKSNDEGEHVMKRKKLMGWKRMAAFAMALSLTLGDGTSVGVVAAQVSDTQAAV